jgi:serine/threonine protein kinase
MSCDNTVCTQTRYHEAIVSGTKLYVVMEYAPFGELKYYIEKAQRAQTPFPEECVWRLFLQLAKCVMQLAVCAAHADVHSSVAGLQ